MTKLLRVVFAICVATTLHFTATAQSLSINTTGAVADASAILDVTSTAKGMLVPRMNKTQKNAITTPANGLMVYQTAPDSIGFHYYDLPNTRWVYINASGFATDTTAWKLTGNSNATAANFLGTTNDSALRFRIRNTASGIIDSASENTALGYKNLQIISAGIGSNTAIGFMSGKNLSSGARNTLIGRNVLSRTGASQQNIGIGDSAISQAISVGNLIGIGFQALKLHDGQTFFTDNLAIGTYSQRDSSFGSTAFWNTSVGGYSLQSNRLGGGNTAMGLAAMQSHKSGDRNTAIGLEAMQFDSAGSVNVAIGWRALRNNKTGAENTAIGVGALESDSSGSWNTAVGRYAGFLNKRGNYNVAMGMQAAVSGDTATATTFLGYASGYYNRSHYNTGVGAYSLTNNNLTTGSNLTGIENTALGYGSGYLINLGSKNTAVGHQAMRGVSDYISGNRNVAMGDSAMTNLTSGSDNTSIGAMALNSNTTGSLHVAVGSRALKNSTATYPNTAIGYSSMDSATTGYANTAVGSYSLTANKTGFNNVAVGNTAMFESTAGSNNTTVGNGAGRLIRDNQNTALGSAALRNDSTGSNNVAIGYQSSFLADSASSVVAIGTEALYFNKSDSNVAIGYRAGWGLGSNLANPAKEATMIGTLAGNGASVSSKNTAIGYKALTQRNAAGIALDYLNGGRNTAIGDSAMAYSIGISNVAIGAQAMPNAGVGVFNNVAIGDSAMGGASLVNENVAIGYKALKSAAYVGSTNTGNTATGAYSARNVTTGYWNTINGYLALENATAAAGNTVMGTSSFSRNVSGFDNVGVGINTGYWVTSGNNTYLGSYAGEGASGFSTGGSNTGVGNFALSDIRTGNGNTAVGQLALAADTSGGANVAIGQFALRNNLASDYNTAVGFSALLNHKRAGFTYNTGLGSFALEQDSSGFQNTGLGTSTFRFNKTGFLNTGVGINAGYYQKESYNTFIGAYSGAGERLPGSNYAADTGNYNAGLGAYALYRIANGENNVAMGYSALYSDSSGNQNTAVGNGALYSNTGSHTNQAFGSNALYSYNGTTSGNNNAFGDLALENLASGTQNVAMGSWAMRSHTSGVRNTAIGNSAMGSTGTTGSSNTAIGDNALLLTNADGNTGVGRNAGNSNTTGTNNTLIGYEADVTTSALTNATAIGYNATVAQSNSLVLGQTGTNVGINTTTPGARLHIRRNGASGGTFLANSSVIIEDNASSFIQLSNTTASENGILSGNALTPIRSGIVFGADSTVFLRAGGNNTRMIIDNNGYVGIGTTAIYPLTQLHLHEPLNADVNFRVSSLGAQQPGLELTKAGASADWKIFNSTGNLLTLARATDDFVTTPQNYYEWGVTAYRPTQDNINSLGLLGQRWTTVFATVGAINTSDARDKENITNLNYGLSEIMKLRPVSFNWKENPQWGKKIGFIAQEVQPILNEVVQVGNLKTKDEGTTDNGKNANAESDKLGIYYSDIIPVAVKAIQEQQKIIDDLKKENEQLKKDMQLIKTKLGINN